ncbi:unnamed protein product [Dicrocoelium dendriticum]|nr:unnamed protein product [Dicrocoelium dendriticum]
MDILKRSRLDKLVDKATNDLLLEPDIESTLAICDLIRGQEISAKTAVASVKRRLQSENTNVTLHTLYVLESMMKNCGSSVHEEVVTPDFLQVLSSLTSRSPEVCTRILNCIQNWAFVFKGRPGFEAIHDVYEDLKSEGFSFPELSESDAMFSVMCAPNWKEENSCHRCKVAFTTFRRRHHCRNCGNSFCAECSSERAVLPKFGIEKEVRVCDHCFQQLIRGPSQENLPTEKQLPPVRDVKAPQEKELSDRELETREAEELELALALSASEAECKARERCRLVEVPQKPQENGERNTGGPLQLLPVLDTSEMDPELARYLNRHYWENRAAGISGAKESAKQELLRSSPTPQPSAPLYTSPEPPVAPSPAMVPVNGFPTTSDYLLKSGNENNTQASVQDATGPPELTNSKQEEFLSALSKSLEFFVNRMQSDSQRDRSIANDTTVQALFLTLHEMHPELLRQKKSMEERRAHFERLQDKLTQLREAREALNALREEHALRRQLEEQEAARLRQLQMMQKLEEMRQQKRDTLEYRRRLAMEQTLHYQQQYQPEAQSAASRPIDQITGLPFMPPVGSYAPPYTFSDAMYASLASTQYSYPPVTTYGVRAPVSEAGYATRDVDSTTYYQNQLPQTQHRPYIYNYPPQPTTAFSHPHPTPYTMQQLETALPTYADPAQLYQPQAQGQPFHSSNLALSDAPNPIMLRTREPPATETRAASPPSSGSFISCLSPGSFIYFAINFFQGSI